MVIRDQSFTRDLTRCNSELTAEFRPCNIALCQVWSLWAEGECITNCTDDNSITGSRRRTRRCLLESESINFCVFHVDKPIFEKIVGLVQLLKTPLLVREVWGSILGPVKSHTVLPTVRHRCFFGAVALALSRGDRPRHSLHMLSCNTASIMKIGFFDIWKNRYANNCFGAKSIYVAVNFFRKVPCLMLWFRDNVAACLIVGLPTLDE